MKLRLSTSRIETIASGYEEVVGPKHWAAEEELTGLRDGIQKRAHLSPGELLMVAKWKSPRSAGGIVKNDDDYVKEVTRFAFKTKHERARIESLIMLHGVAWPTASVVLHLFHKDCYPILDFRALWSANTKPAQYDYPFWEEYVLFCRKTAQQNGVDMRTLDRAMWCYSRKHQSGGRS